MKAGEKQADLPTSRDKKHRMILKMIASYSIFLLIIFILFFCSYAMGIKNVLNQYEWRQKSILMSNAALFEKEIGIMHACCRQLLQTSGFMELLNAEGSAGNFDKNFDESFAALGKTAAEQMASDVYPEALLPVSERFCYLPASGYVLAPDCFAAQDVYYSQIRHCDEKFHEAWLKALTSPECHNCFTPVNGVNVTAPPSGSESPENYYIYIVSLCDLTGTDTDAVACFVFEQEKLASLFDCLNTDAGYHYLSVHTKQGGTVLSISGGDDFAPENTTADGIRNFLKAAGITMDSYTSENTGFSYDYSYPSIFASSNFARPQILHLSLFVAAFLGGILLTLLLARRNLQPFIELDQELQTANREKTNLMEEKSYLQEVVDNQKPMICNSYVRQLLRGMIASKEETAYAKDFLGLTEEGLVFNALYLVVYNNADTETKQSSASGPHTLEKCNSVILETLRKYFGEKIYCFSPSDRTYALIVTGHANDETDLVTSTGERVIQMHDALLDAYGIWLFAGIGKNTDDLGNVWECYQQAQDAANYASRNAVFFPYDRIKKDSSAFYYPTELSTKLIHFITTGNTPQVLELFGLLHQENIEERALPVHMLQFLLSDIRNTLLKARFALPPNTPDGALTALDECFNQHVSFKLCEDIALRLCTLFTVETNDSSLISAIEKYIKENYADPAMGLNKIADAFQISESYFSHMFKEKTGVNFSIYLENIRMSEAARLIKKTDTSLNELYILVGYNNANTFRRAFKKVYGVTPSAMREMKPDVPS